MSAYANNHYAGFAPATVQLFQPLWDKRAMKMVYRGYYVRLAR